MGAPGKVKDEKEIRKGYREDKTGTACIIVWRCVVVRCHNVKNGKEASEVTYGKSSRMRWGR